MAFWMALPVPRIVAASTRSSVTVPTSASLRPDDGSSSVDASAFWPASILTRLRL